MVKNMKHQVTHFLLHSKISLINKIATLIVWFMQIVIFTMSVYCIFFTKVNKLSLADSIYLDGVLIKEDSTSSNTIKTFLIVNYIFLIINSINMSQIILTFHDKQTIKVTAPTKTTPTILRKFYSIDNNLHNIASFISFLISLYVLLYNIYLTTIIIEIKLFFVLILISSVMSTFNLSLQKINVKFQNE